MSSWSLLPLSALELVRHYLSKDELRVLDATHQAANNAQRVYVAAWEEPIYMKDFYWFARCRNLHILDLSRGYLRVEAANRELANTFFVTDQHIACITKIHSLWILKLMPHAVTDEALRPILTKLKPHSLLLSQLFISLKNTRSFHSLTSLTLKNTKFNYGLAILLKSNPNLIYLNLQNTLRTAAADRAIGGLQNLRFLNLCETRITDAMLQLWAGIPRMHDLLVSSTHLNREFTDAGLKTIVASWPWLKTLEIGGAKVTTEGINHALSFLPYLQRFEMSGPPITDATLLHLGLFHKNLRDLTLRNGWFSSDSVIFLVSHCTQLQKLSLMGSVAVDDSVMPAICRLKNLKTLNLAVTSVTVAGQYYF